MRYIDMIPTPPRRGMIPKPMCEYTGCKNTTAERKPYCIDHIEHNSEYVRSLIKLKDTDETLKADILAVLQGSKAATAERLKSQITWPGKRLKRALEELVTAGRLKKIERIDVGHRKVITCYALLS